MLSRVRLLAFLLVPVALLTVGCHKKASQGWFPLVLGSKWTHNLTGSSGNGSFAVTVTDVNGITHHAKATADSGVALSTVFPFSYLDGFRYYTVSGDTTWLGAYGGESPAAVVVQPLEVDDVWRWWDWWTDSAVVAGKTDVVVPAGTFKDCYQVDYYVGNLEQVVCRICYAEGVGAVKGEGFTSPTWKFELKSADLP